MKQFLPKALPHLIAILVFIILSFAFLSPTLKSQKLKRHDVKQAEGMSQYNRTHRDKTGEIGHWSPTMFAGMPAYMIYMDYPKSLSTQLGRFLVHIFPDPVNYLVIYMLGAYIAMLMLGYNPFVSTVGALAFAFSCYNVINIQAGHISKVIAVATAPPFIASIIMTYRGKFWLGGALTVLFAGIHQYSNFIQMTYYLTFSIVILGIVELIHAIRTQRLKSFAMATGIIVIAGLISLGTHASRYWANYQYSKETTRGKSDLSQSPTALLHPDKASKPTKTSSGLDKDYAFQWSYGKVESLNLLIPNFSGGGSQQQVEQDSKTFNAVIAFAQANRQDPNQILSFLYQNGVMPSMYWGDQHSGTGGPAYMGALLLFLFVFGMIVSKDRLKWWGLATVIFFLMIAWGKYLSWFNYPMFDYFPLFNKFRAVTMVLSILPLPLMMVAGLGLKEVFDFAQEAAPNEEDRKKWLKALLISGASVGGLILFIILLGGSVFGFEGFNDQNIMNALTQATKDRTFGLSLITAIKQDRISLMRADAWRSLIFVLLGSAALWAIIAQKAKAWILIAAIALLTLVDLWQIDRRYLNKSHFESKNASRYYPTEQDKEILKDPSYYRVLNLTVSPFNDATTSYYHHSIGGYHGAKLQRYQELIEGHIQANNLEVLSMLNTKYIIVPTEQGVKVQTNPNALGNAWLVEDYKLVPNADKELVALKDFKAAKTAIVDKKFAPILKGLKIKYNASNTIKLLSHTPNELTYESNTDSPQLAVFSEIYYNNASGWKAFIDGKEVDHLRADYVLRALVLPKGKHKITFKMVPSAYNKGETISLVFSILMIIMIALCGWMYFKEYKKTKGE